MCERGLGKYFNSIGVPGLMRGVIDKDGIRGLRKMASPKALLEFYSYRKGLNWFDNDKPIYLTILYNKNKKLKNGINTPTTCY